MDAQRISDLLAGTTNPDPKIREPAEKTLEQIHKIIGFAPKLLEIVRDNDQFPVRQAASIYLKNNISKYWENHNPQANDPTQFIIHDQDKTLVRDSIIDVIVQNGQVSLLSVHLVSCCNYIIKADFPHQWPSVVDKIHFLLQQNDFNSWNASLLVFYQLAKIYEYRNSHERKPFLEALRILLPTMSQRMSQLLQSDPLGESSCNLQKQVLKIFHAILQYSLPTTVLTQDVFNQWMVYIVDIAKRDVPEAPDVMVDDRPELIWWKCKKWSFHLMSRIFERYGSPNNVSKEYKQFAEWYIKTFSYPTIQTIIKTLEQYALGQYVSPRVMQQALNYLNTAVLHSMTWKMLKDDMMVVVEKIIYPLMSYTDEDEELWHSDPREYIRMKFDIFEEYVSPVSASNTLLYNLCKKRRDMLQKTMNFVIGVLNNPQTGPKSKDGALHMIGSISSVLMKKPLYKDQLEQLITNYVLPLFACPEGFLRARACWMLSYFVSIPFQNPATIIAATQAVLQCILADRDLPVKVEASICLQSLLSGQNESCLERVQEVTKPNVKPLAMELVQIIRLTGNEDVMEVLQKIVYLFPEDLYAVALELTNHMAQTFHELISSPDGGEEDERISSAMAVLSTIDTVLTMMDEKKEIIAKLEPIVVNIVLTIFEKSAVELYEEATTLLSTITADGVSPEAWRAFQTLYLVFKRDGCDYFTDMMSPLHNYITVDPQTFIASRQNLAAIYEMCHQILTDPYCGEEVESYAAKLLEVVILQFRNQIDDCIPSFIELAITRLKREITTSELRTLLLQIVIAAFYSNYELLFNCFEKLQQQGNLPPFTLFDSFVKQWFKDIKEFLGLHDRKMCIIGICTMILLPQEKRPPVVNEIASQIVPAVLVLYDRLKIAYEKRANSEADSDTEDDDDDEEEDSDQEAEVLEDDQDHIGSNSKFDNDNDEDFEDIADEEGEEDYEDDSDDDCEQTALESFETIVDMEKGFVDEFVLFRDSMEKIRQENVNWYQTLLAPLDQNQRKKLIELGQFTEKRELNRWNAANNAQQQQQQQQQVPVLRTN